MCFPTDEDRLGFRRLQYIVDTFSLKLWWLFRSQNFLWAQFLLDNYCKGTHLSLESVLHSAFPIWKRLKRFAPSVKPHIAWHLGAGKIFFGKMLDRWFHISVHLPTQTVHICKDVGFFRGDWAWLWTITIYFSTIYGRTDCVHSALYRCPILHILEGFIRWYIYNQVSLVVDSL